MTWSYRPDADPTTPNVITSIIGGLIPTINRGWRGPYPMGPLWTNATAGCDGYNGSFLAINTGGTARVFFGANDTTGRIYEATGSATRTDRSRGGNYTASAFFSFCQLGDTTIAANKSDALQSSTTGAFADVTGSPPKAKLCVADANQVVLLNYNDGTDTPDGWWCSDVGSTTSWTPPSAASPSAVEARNGRLRDTGGAITAACNAPFGGVMAFKKSSFYVGSYTGQPLVRSWRKVSDKIGCRWSEACVNVGDRVYFVGDDVYEFDGSKPVSITEGIFNFMRVFLENRVALQYDYQNDILYLYYGDNYTTGFVGCFAYHARTREWGLSSILRAPVIVGGYYPCGVLNGTKNELGLVFSGAASAAAAASNYVWGSASNSVLTTEALGCYGLTSKTIPTDAALDISWTLSYQGDYSKMSTVQRVTPNIKNASSVAAVSNPTGYALAIVSSRYTPYGYATAGVTSVMNIHYRFDILANGHWHKATYNVDVSAASGNFEWFDQSVEYVQAGKA